MRTARRNCRLNLACDLGARTSPLLKSAVSMTELSLGSQARCSHATHDDPTIRKSQAGDSHSHRIRNDATRGGDLQTRKDQSEAFCPSPARSKVAHLFRCAFIPPRPKLCNKKIIKAGYSAILSRKWASALTTAEYDVLVTRRSSLALKKRNIARVDEQNIVTHPTRQAACTALVASALSCRPSHVRGNLRVREQFRRGVFV